MRVRHLDIGSDRVGQLLIGAAIGQIPSPDHRSDIGLDAARLIGRLHQDGGAIGHRNDRRAGPAVGGRRNPRRPLSAQFFRRSCRLPSDRPLPAPERAGPRSSGLSRNFQAATPTRPTTSAMPPTMRAARRNPPRSFRSGLGAAGRWASRAGRGAGLLVDRGLFKGLAFARRSFLVRNLAAPAAAASGRGRIRAPAAPPLRPAPWLRSRWRFLAPAAASTAIAQAAPCGARS